MNLCIISADCGDLFMNAMVPLFSHGDMRLELGVGRAAE